MSACYEVPVLARDSVWVSTMLTCMAAMDPFTVDHTSSDALLPDALLDVTSLRPAA